MSKPKHLLIDYETSPAKGRFFGPIWETNIVDIIEYEKILSVAWKFYGEKATHVIGLNDFKNYKAGVLDDKELVKFFLPIIEQADTITAHNGDNFDIKVFNTRLLAHGFNPMPVEKTFDTKKISKSKFHFPSNKLDDIADFLNIPRKLTHTGISMWKGCEDGNVKDWSMMKRYNRHDVVILEMVMQHIFPFMKQKNDYISVLDRGINCPNPLCLSLRMIRVKKRPVKNGFKQQYQCTDCGSYWTDSKLIHF